MAFVLTLAIALATNFRPVWAHTTVEVGEYEVELGWAIEPPQAGQANQIVIDIQPKPGSQAPEAEISGLTFTISQGDFMQTLSVVSANEAPGEYEADFTPARAGQYTVSLTGTLDGKAVEIDIEPEPVEPGTVAIPAVELGEARETGPFQLIAAVAIGVAVVFGVVALLVGRRKT
jgi:hypothetical protein